MNRIINKGMLCLMAAGITISAMAQSGADEGGEDSLIDELQEDTTFTLLPDDPVMEMLDRLVLHKYTAFHQLETDTTKLNIYGFPTDSLPEYSDEIYRERLEMLNAATPFNLEFNKNVKAYIHLYADKRRNLTSRLLGLSKLYFPLFEETLDRYDMPVELKYLAIIESALNPTARSRSGAVGLWQFMYNTGKIYGLQANSYLDDRQDPYKSTVAACKYLLFLHGLYDNWELALAAYNCGPGNINKAIRRSGGKKDYWELWPYLPRETRGYVPAFIAVNYIMNFPAEHNLYPIEPNTTWFEFDTVHVSQQVTFEQITAVLEIPKNQLEYLNPVYKKGIIPAVGEPMALYLPHDKIGLFIQNEEIIYQYNKEPKEEEAEEELIVEQTRKTHIVRSGEYLGSIANKYHCSVNDIKDWNGLISTRIRPNQKLIVYVPEAAPVAKKEQKPEKVLNDEDYEYYIIREGDTLWDIARLKGITVSHLEQLNKNINVKRLKPGSKIIVGSAG